MPIRSVLRSVLPDGSIVSTMYLGMAFPGPESPLEALCHDEESCEVDDGEYWFETAIQADGEDDWRVLRRHKTEAQAIVWHEEYLDKVLVVRK